MDAPEILARYRDADGTVPPHVCLTLLARYATGQPDEGEARVTALEALAAAHHLATAARAVYEPLVAAAQAEGASWADIGAALGISRQAAHNTYRHADAPSDPRREIMLSLFRRPAPAPAEEQQIRDLQEQIRDLQEQIRDLQQTAHSQMSTTDLVTASLADLSGRITNLEDAQKQPAPEPVAEEEDEYTRLLRARRDRVIQHHISQSVAHGGKPSPEHIALAQAVPLLPLEHFDPEVSYHHGSGEQYWLINGRQCDYGGALDQLMHVHGLTREEARALLDSCRR